MSLEGKVFSKRYSPTTVVSRSEIAARRSPPDCSTISSILSSGSLTSCPETILLKTPSMSSASIDAKVNTLHLLTRPVKRGLWGSFAVITIGWPVSSIIFRIALTPPLSLVPDRPSISSNRMIRRRPSSVCCVAAFHTRSCTTPLLRLSLELNSTSSIS